MDEYTRGVEPGLKRFFRQILKSVSVGLLWLFVLMVFGLYFKLALVRDGLHAGNFIFYGFLIVSLPAYIFYLTRVWRKAEGVQEL